jgi:uncharacterized radical SAM protein YgiQ
MFMGSNMNETCLPCTSEEVRARSWDEVDIVLVTGDVYVDHPSFGTAVIGRVLEEAGFRVAVLSQPGWNDSRDFERYGRPRLFFGISSGNMDSMINRYTALKKIRNDDAYSEGGEPFRRPDRAAVVYAQRAREAFRDVPIVLGGIEASLRRFAHYDYWSDRIRRSILLDAKADLLVYGMGESQVAAIAERLAAGEGVAAIRDLRGIMFAPLEREDFVPDHAVPLPSFEEIARDKEAYNIATMLVYEHANPFRAKTLVQYHGNRPVVQLPPPLPLSEEEMDRIYDLPYTRKPHPSYQRPIPAFEMIRNSIAIMRGCFGGCSFCSIALHQGSFVQQRSESSVVREVERCASDPNFDGTITDLGGPTANMYGMKGRDLERCASCNRLSCLFPRHCSNLNTDHDRLIELMKKVRRVRGVNHLFIASGIRMDLANLSERYIREIASHHTSGHLKVAPEHVSPGVLNLMRKPALRTFEDFYRLFSRFSREAGKEQYLVPYLIASHPGTTLERALELALYLKDHGYRPRQIQDFLPSPMSVATAMYYTGKDPISGKAVAVPRGEREKKLYRALVHYFKEENRDLICRSLRRLGKEEWAERLTGPS